MPGPTEAFAFLARVTDLEKDPDRRAAARFLTLDRIRRLCARMGHPERGPAWFVHIAGTKGKGSTAAMTAAAIQAAGLRTGLYTSPHVRNFGERIQVDGHPIPRATFAALLAPHLAWARRLPKADQPTWFEWVTALALVHFRARACEAVVLETGLGGRLDATNVVRPAASAITRIDYDHMELLGNTLARIAREKAGILKPGVPCVLGPQAPEALRVVRRRAGRLGSPLVRARPLRGLRLAMPGRHQQENAAVALGILGILRDQGRIRLSDAAARQALAGVALAARVQILSRRPPFVVDGAHTPLSVRRTAETLAGEFPGRRWTVVLGAARDKDLGGILRALKPVCTRLIATPFDNPRSRPAAGITAAARDAGIPAEVAADPAEALRLARGAVCVTGSLWLAGQVLSLRSSPRPGPRRRAPRRRTPQPGRG